MNQVSRRATKRIRFTRGLGENKANRAKIPVGTRRKGGEEEGGERNGRFLREDGGSLEKGAQGREQGGQKKLILTEGKPVW